MNTKSQSKPLFQGTTALILSLSVSLASAATLSLSSATHFATPGDTVKVDFNISGLGNNALGAFDANLGFNDTWLVLQGATFGTGLGNTLPTDPIVPTPGKFFEQLSQVSLELSADLMLNQPDSFTLATLTFLVTKPSFNVQAPIGISINPSILSDVNGDPISYTTTGMLAFESAAAAPSAVPAPAAWWLFSASFALVEGTRRWSGKRAKA